MEATRWRRSSIRPIEIQVNSSRHQAVNLTLAGGAGWSSGGDDVHRFGPRRLSTKIAQVVGAPGSRVVVTHDRVRARGR